MQICFAFCSQSLLSLKKMGSSGLEEWMHGMCQPKNQPTFFIENFPFCISFLLIPIQFNITGKNFLHDPRRLFFVQFWENQGFGRGRTRRGLLRIEKPFDTSAGNPLSKRGEIHLAKAVQEENPLETSCSTHPPHPWISPPSPAGC